MHGILVVPNTDLDFLAINGHDAIELGRLGIVRIDLPKGDTNIVFIHYRHLSIMGRGGQVLIKWDYVHTRETQTYLECYLHFGIHR